MPLDLTEAALKHLRATGMPNDLIKLLLDNGEGRLTLNDARRLTKMSPVEFEGAIVRWAPFLRTGGLAEPDLGVARQNQRLKNQWADVMDRPNPLSRPATEIGERAPTAVGERQPTRMPVRQSTTTRSMLPTKGKPLRPWPEGPIGPKPMQMLEAQMDLPWEDRVAARTSQAVAASEPVYVTPEGTPVYAEELADGPGGKSKAAPKGKAAGASSKASSGGPKSQWAKLTQRVKIAAKKGARVGGKVPGGKAALGALGAAGRLGAKAFWPLGAAWMAYDIYDAIAGPAVGVSDEERMQRAQRAAIERMMLAEGMGDTSSAHMLGRQLLDMKEAYEKERVMGAVARKSDSLGSELAELMGGHEAMMAKLTAGAWGAYPPSMSALMRARGY